MLVDGEQTLHSLRYLVDVCSEGPTTQASEEAFAHRTAPLRTAPHRPHHLPLYLPCSSHAPASLPLFEYAEAQSPINQSFVILKVVENLVDGGPPVRWPIIGPSRGLIKARKPVSN